MEDQVAPDLRSRAVTALAWTYGGSVVRMGLQFLAGILLARLLGPAPFGMIAAAWALIGVAGQFADCGFGAALVQSGELNALQIRFAFTVQTLLGLALSGAMALASGALAGWLGNPALAGVLRALSLVVALQAAGQTAVSLLRRALDLRALQLAQLAGTLAGYGGVALPMAIHGYGVGSLVAGQLTQSAVTTILAYINVRHSVLPSISREGAGLFRFGITATATNLVNWLLAGVDTVAMTRYFGAVACGWLNRAQALALGPGGQVAQGLQSVLFPAYSQRTKEPAILRRVYLASLAGLTLVLLPAGVIGAVAARTIVRGLYGAAWDPAAGLLVPLALAMPVHCAMSLNGPLLWALGRVSEELKVQAGVLLLFAISLMGAGRLTATALAWTVLLVYVVRCGVMMERTLAVSGVRRRDCAKALLGPAAIAAFASVVTIAADALSAAWPPQLRLGFVLVSSTVLTAGAAIGCGSWLLTPEIRALWRSCLERLPGVGRVLPAPRREAWGDAL